MAQGTQEQGDPRDVDSAPLALSEFDTAPIAPSDRFDAWRSRHPTVSITTTDRASAECFQGRFLATPRGTSGELVSLLRCTENHARFGRDGRDLVLLSLTLRGSIAVSRGGGDPTVLTARNGLVLLRGDAATRADVGRDGHEHIFFAMPHELAVGALRSDVLRPGESVRHIGGPQIALYLRDQLQAMAGVFDGLREHEAGVILSGIADVSLATLSEIGRDDAGPTPADRALYEAARRYIAVAHEDPELTAGAIAAALNCSRTHLYAVFARFDDTVVRALRDARLSRAGQLLLGTRLPIAQIARSVGYSNESAFARAFRQQFAVTPGEYRQRLGR